MSVRKIISGGQTGVDRVALDVAIELDIECGGWCPKDRRAEDGRIDHRYPLRETPSPDYAQRTEWNVRDSDGTLIIAREALTGGTALTRRFVRRHHKSCIVVNPNDEAAVARIGQWLEDEGICTLNIAGPRESQDPGIGEAAATLLRQAFAS